MEWIPIIAILSSFGAAVLIVYFVTKSRQRRVEVQAEMQAKMIERFGSATEMAAFLQSPAGKEFVAGVQTSPENVTRDRIIGSFTRSIVVSALGGGFLFLTFWEDRDFVVPAAIVLSLGIGYFIATFVSWRLSASLHSERS